MHWLLKKFLQNFSEVSYQIQDKKSYNKLAQCLFIEMTECQEIDQKHKVSIFFDQIEKLFCLGQDSILQVFKYFLKQLNAIQDQAHQKIAEREYCKYGGYIGNVKKHQHTLKMNAKCYRIVQNIISNQQIYLSLLQGITKKGLEQIMCLHMLENLNELFKLNLTSVHQQLLAILKNEEYIDLIQNFLFYLQQQLKQFIATIEVHRRTRGTHFLRSRPLFTAPCLWSQFACSTAPLCERPASSPRAIHSNTRPDAPDSLPARDQTRNT